MNLPKTKLTNEKIEALVKRIAKDGYYSDNNTNQDWYPERLLELRTLIHQAEIKASLDEWKLISETVHSAGITSELYVNDYRKKRLLALEKEIVNE